MKIKLAVAALALVVATPAFAVDYYVVQNAKSKKCTVATKKPASDKVVLVGDSAGYKTKKDAQTALKGADACKTKA
jgi:opacity protein-like surface antigen